jgi:phosphatidylinositol-3-phosphatase
VRRALAVVALLIAGTGCASAASAQQVAQVRSQHAAPRPTASPSSDPPHVFLLVLENESYKQTYLNEPKRYIGKNLEKQGTLLTQYHAIGHFSLDNYIAMISGQAPNPDTSGDCGSYVNFNRTTKPAKINSRGQAVGVGCVYPSNVMTLPNQLSALGISWHGYMEDMGNTPSREQKRCGVPTLLKHRRDDTQLATKKDQYAARHNPFVYFHSLIDPGLCTQNVVPLTALPDALKSVDTTPHFSFITPDLCDDGHDSPCRGRDSRGSKAGGLVSANHFLSVWVPRIERSPAYQDNGLIIITSDESETTDSSKCCNEKPGPNEHKPGIFGPGGGRIGTLVIGQCVQPGVKDARPYDHYSLLRSLENLFGISTGGSDGLGHLGYAGATGLRPFGKDLFATCAPS